MAKCDVCGKIGRSGHNVSHSKRHTPARWLPNVQSVRLSIAGASVRKKLCTRCLRTQYRTPRV